MTTRKTRVVDWLSVEQRSGDVVLTLVDDEDWSNEQEHLALLQEKLNSYLAFIESGEIYEQPDPDLASAISRTANVRVQIVARYDLPARGKAFVGYAQRTFTGAGFTLIHSVQHGSASGS